MSIASPCNSLENHQATLTRVLVIAQDEKFCKWADRRLRSDGFAVVTTDDGIDAIAMAQSDPPDLIVLGHVVRWLDARYLLTRLKRDAQTSKIPILLVATSSGDSPDEESHPLGSLRLVTSPSASRADNLTYARADAVISLAGAATDGVGHGNGTKAGAKHSKSVATRVAASGRSPRSEAK